MHYVIFEGRLRKRNFINLSGVRNYVTTAWSHSPLVTASLTCLLLLNKTQLNSSNYLWSNLTFVFERVWPQLVLHSQVVWNTLRLLEFLVNFLKCVYRTVEKNFTTKIIRVQNLHKKLYWLKVMTLRNAIIMNNGITEIVIWF